MLQIRLTGHSHDYPVCDVVRLLTGVIPKYEEGTVWAQVPFDAVIESKVIPGKEVLTEVLSGFPDLSFEKRCIREMLLGPEEPVTKDGLSVSREVKRQLYALLCDALEKRSPWGSLTGIRPTQVASEASGPSDLTRIYGVREDKAKLAFSTKEGEEQVLSASDPGSLHIYIGIPFCPSRCAYCSFVAQEAPRKRDLLPSYVDAVLKEIDLVLPHISFPIETLYIGGGTPTVLDEELFSRLIQGVFSRPELKALKEICVEAGRPDTITEGKLQTLLSCGITRICINPQTLCNETLARVGRKHTAEDFESAFAMARKMGFSVINTDLIAGIPGESAEEFCESLRRIISLEPENITVHSLSKKRRSDLSREEIVRQEEEDLSKMEVMLGYSYRALSEAGYKPYYLYKQKDTLGGHENVGYQKGDTPCIYNVAMMSDQRSVLSFGAGGMSKRIYPQEGNHVRIERCACIKEPTQYIRDVEEMAKRKISFFSE